MKTTTLRLRRVRFKNGNTVEVLRTKAEDVAGRMRESADRALEFNHESPVVGYVVIAWYQNGHVFPCYFNGDRSSILACQVPQYAKDVLLAEQAVRWSRE